MIFLGIGALNRYLVYGEIMTLLIGQYEQLDSTPTYSHAFNESSWTPLSRSMLTASAHRIYELTELVLLGISGHEQDAQTRTCVDVIELYV